MSNDNPNWKETKKGWVRSNTATPVKGASIDWGRVDKLQETRRAVEESRQKQNERNEEYKRKHGG